MFFRIMFSIRYDLFGDRITRGNSFCKFLINFATYSSIILLELTQTVSK